MTADPGTDGNRISRWMRRISRHETEPETPPPTVEITVTPSPGDEDWLDRLFAQQAEDAEAEASAEPDENTTPWYSLGKHRPAPAAAPESHQPAPGVQVNINPPAAPSPEDERTRQRRIRMQLWVAYHGSAAGVGWYIGLGPQMADLLNASGQAAPAVGVGLIVLTGWPLAYLKPHHLPASLQPVITWASRIAPSTAALVLALHASHPLI
ncbi:hypothetical protein [Streptomyces sp. NRRL S-1813]|uniref:hypothetical protein n=1 Tax=Streptomyces sp. NRRL S-1813 TaxID=1463888 RepID=UPI0004C75539|nr:hypothetical protein [Streptomyces sp. NRRL S-1813]